MSQDNSTALVPDSPASSAIKALEERRLAYKEEQRSLARKQLISMAVWSIVELLSAFFGPHGQLQQELLMGITGAPMVLFALKGLSLGGDRKELSLVRNLANFDDPAIVWTLLPMIGSLDHATYWVVSGAVTRVLGRCDEWQTGEWSDEQWLILQEAAEWLVSEYARPDPELTEVVERALTPALASGRPTLVRSAARAITRIHRPPGHPESR